MATNNLNEQNNIYLSKLKEENNTLNQNIERLYKENKEFREKVIWLIITDNLYGAGSAKFLQ